MRKDARSTNGSPSRSDSPRACASSSAREENRTTSAMDFPFDLVVAMASAPHDLIADMSRNIGR